MLEERENIFICKNKQIDGKSHSFKKVCGGENEKKDSLLKLSNVYLNELYSKCTVFSFSLFLQMVLQHVRKMQGEKVKKKGQNLMEILYLL